MVSGYQVNNASTINAQIEFKQDFGFWVPGLTARAMGYTQRYSFFSTTRQYNPFYYKADLTSQGVVLTPFNDGGNASIGTPGTEYLNYNEGEKKVSTAYYGEAVINYDRTFADKHQVTGMLIGTIRHSIVGNAGTLEGSLPSRNLGLSGRFTYGFDSRYLLELTSVTTAPSVFRATSGGVSSPRSAAVGSSPTKNSSPRSRRSSPT